MLGRAQPLSNDVFGVVNTRTEDYTWFVDMKRRDAALDKLRRRAIDSGLSRSAAHNIVYGLRMPFKNLTQVQQFEIEIHGVTPYRGAP